MLFFIFTADRKLTKRWVISNPFRLTFSRYKIMDAKKGIIYIVDDDEAVRDSLQWLLESQGFHVITFESAETFLERFNPNQLACLLVDVRMQGMSGLVLHDKLIEINNAMPLAFITGHGDIPMAVERMKKGAIDFVQKPFDEKVLIQLVNKMQNLAQDNFSRKKAMNQRQEQLSRLTPRELQVLDLIVAGRLNKQIADDLHISIKTVEVHRANLMDKLNVSTVADLLKVVLGK